MAVQTTPQMLPQDNIKRRYSSACLTNVKINAVSSNEVYMTIKNWNPTKKIGYSYISQDLFLGDIVEEEAFIRGVERCGYKQ